MELLKTLAEHQQLIPLVEKVSCEFHTIHKVVAGVVHSFPPTPPTPQKSYSGKCLHIQKLNNKIQ